MLKAKKLRKSLSLAGVPPVARFRSWFLNTIRDIIVASGRLAEVKLWIFEVAAAKTWQELVDPPEFESLSMKVASGLAKIDQGPLCRRINTIEKN